MNASVTAISAAVVFGWDSAYALIDTDHGIEQALSAILNREPTMPWGAYDDPVCPYARLGDTADLALAASEKCRAAGLGELAERCRAIDARLRRVCVLGRKDVRAASTELEQLMASAKAALSAVDL